MRAPRILFVVTHPLTAFTLLRGQLAHLRQAGFHVAVACAPGEQLDAVAEREGVEIFPIPLEREIRPWADLRALLALIGVMRRFRPDLVNAGTPKGGLLGSLAAWIARVPRRLYVVRGLRLETTRGAARQLFLLTERLAALAANRVICVSPSLERRVHALGIAPPPKTTVLGAGSSNGVDVARFHPVTAAERREHKRQLDIPGDVPVVGFVGRLTRDKGIRELTEAFFGPITEAHPDARLLLVGDFEDGDPVPEATRHQLAQSAKVVCAGFVDDTAPFYAAMDVMAFPSYREGFPNTPLEAAASGVAVVGCEVTGTVDAVVDGKTGLLVPAGDALALGEALARLLDDATLGARLGTSGRERVERHFRHARVWESWVEEYRQQLSTDRRSADR